MVPVSGLHPYAKDTDLRNRVSIFPCKGIFFFKAGWMQYVCACIHTHTHRPACRNAVPVAAMELSELKLGRLQEDQIVLLIIDVHCTVVNLYYKYQGHQCVEYCQLLRDTRIRK